jgi:hypothetical protein
MIFFFFLIYYYEILTSTLAFWTALFCVHTCYVYKLHVICMYTYCLQMKHKYLCVSAML